MTILHLLSGKVSSLKTQQGYKNFISSSAGRAATQAGAIGAAASGAFFNSGVLTTASMIREGVTYYTCKVDGVNISGYLNTVAFKNTDEVEFVVEYNRSDSTQALAYAVRKPKERKLWVMDRMGDGINIMKQICWRFPLICMVVIIPIWLLFVIVVNLISDGDIEFLADYWFEVFVLGMGGGF